MPQLDWNLHHHASLQVHLNLHYHASPQVHSDLQFHVSQQVHPWNLRQSRCPGCMAQHKFAAHDNLLHHGEHPLMTLDEMCSIQSCTTIAVFMVHSMKKALTSRARKEG